MHLFNTYQRFKRNCKLFSNRVAQLKAGRGWVKRDDNFLERYEETNKYE